MNPVLSGPVPSSADAPNPTRTATATPRVGWGSGQLRARREGMIEKKDC